MPEADILSAITKLSDRVDTQTMETHKIVEGLAMRQAETEKALQELKDFVMRSNVEARVDAIEGRLQALHQDIMERRCDDLPRKSARVDETAPMDRGARSLYNTACSVCSATWCVAKRPHMSVIYCHETNILSIRQAGDQCYSVCLE